MLYKNIQIYKTHFSEKYLLKVSTNTMLVGYIVKDIVELLQKETSKIDITQTINNKHNLNIQKDEILNIISKIDHSLFSKKSSFLVKFFKVLNPDKLHFPASTKIVFKKKVFYTLFFLTIILNLYAFNNLKHVTSTHYNWIIIYSLILFIVFLHELGHAIAARSFGIKTPEIGFGVYLIFPVFYIDLGEAWTLNKQKRTLINLSGIYVQLIVGVLLYFLSINIENNGLLKAIFYTNFTILFFNLNPFLKFDGYWIVSDLLGENDLMRKSNRILKNLLLLKIPNEKTGVLLYTFLKLCFIIAMLYLASTQITQIFKALKAFNIADWYTYIIPLLLFGSLIYAIKLNQNHEFSKRKKSSQKKVKQAFQKGD